MSNPSEPVAITETPTYLVSRLIPAKMADATKREVLFVAKKTIMNIKLTVLVTKKSGSDIAPVNRVRNTGDDKNKMQIKIEIREDGFYHNNIKIGTHEECFAYEGKI